MKTRHLTEVQDWMTENPVTVAPDATLAQAYDLMQENDVRTPARGRARSGGHRHRSATSCARPR